MVKNFIKKIPVKIAVFTLFSVVCLLLTGVILIFEYQIQKGLYDQQMAKRWSREAQVSQISVFFAENEVENVDYFKTIEHSVDTALQAASISKEKEGARLWIDAVSRGGEVVLSNQRANIQLNAIGVEGEFFQFHPLTLVTGSLLSSDNMMKDGIVIDVRLLQP